MSSISPATAISAIQFAHHTVSQVGKTVGDALGFDEFLNPAETNSTSPALGDLRDQFASSANQTLALLGLSANPVASFSIQTDGQIHVSGHHPQAARIEAAVNGDPELADVAKQIAKQSGGHPVVIEGSPPADLTDSGPEINIHARQTAEAGGYANWLAD